MVILRIYSRHECLRHQLKLYITCSRQQVITSTLTTDNRSFAEAQSWHLKVARVSIVPWLLAHRMSYSLSDNRGTEQDEQETTQPTTDHVLKVQMDLVVLNLIIRAVDCWGNYLWTIERNSPISNLTVVTLSQIWLHRGHHWLKTNNRLNYNF